MSDNKYSSQVQCEKKQKYGSTKANFLKTLVVILVLLIIALPLRRQVNENIASAKHLIYYPKNTEIYFDIDTKYFNKFIKNNKYLSELANNSERFSFGFWQDQSFYNKLAIFEFKPDSTPKLQVNKLKTESYKHHLIYYLEGKQKFYMVDGEKLFITDNSAVLKKIIENIESKRLGLFEQKDIRNLVKKLNKKRNGTLFVFNHNKILKNKFLKNISFFDNVADIFDKSVFSINFDDKYLYLNGKTLLSTNDKFKKEELKKYLNKSMSMSKYSYLPESTSAYVTINDFSSFINLILTLEEVKMLPEYTQILQFIKKSFNVDIEQDLISAFKGFVSIGFVKSSNDEVAPVVVFKADKKIENSLKKIIKLIQFKSDIFKLDKTIIAEKHFNILISKKHPNICFGNLNEDLYILGEQNAVKNVIKSFNQKKLKEIALISREPKVFMFVKSLEFNNILNKYLRKNISILDNFEYYTSEISADKNGLNAHIRAKLRD